MGDDGKNGIAKFLEKYRDMTKLALLLVTVVYLFGCQADVSLSSATTNVSPTSTPPPINRIPDASDDVFLAWKETIGSTEYRWDGKDLFIRRNKAQETGIFSQAARKYRSSFEKSGDKCRLDSYFTPSAVVGDLVSYEHESDFGGDRCGVMSGEWRYATVDISDSTRFHDLRNFFAEDQLLKAFLANPQLSSDIQKSVDSTRLDGLPTTLKELSTYLTGRDYEIFNGESYFEPDYLERFVFHHTEGDMVCVRVSASSTSTAGRAIHEYAEILLPVPERLRDSLKKADARDAGFLMKDAAATVGTKAATVGLTF